MNIKKLSIAAYVAAVILSGCASTTPIQTVSSSKSEFEGAFYGGKTTTISKVVPRIEEYRVFHQGASGFVSIQSIRSDAERRAVEFCNRNNKIMKELRETIAKPPYILGNFPRIEIVFACIAKSTAQ